MRSFINVLTGSFVLFCIFGLWSDIISLEIPTFLQKHGSLFAAILAVLGVAITLFHNTHSSFLNQRIIINGSKNLFLLKLRIIKDDINNVTYVMEAAASIGWKNSDNYLLEEIIAKSEVNSIYSAFNPIMEINNPQINDILLDLVKLLISIQRIAVSAKDDQTRYRENVLYDINLSIRGAIDEIRSKIFQLSEIEKSALTI